MTYRITADPQRDHTVYNIWRGGTRIARNVPDEATANLFASAPELLEALEDAIEELREYELAASGEHYNNPRFNAIIAKAKEG